MIKTKFRNKVTNMRYKLLQECRSSVNEEKNKNKEGFHFQFLYTSIQLTIPLHSAAALPPLVECLAVTNIVGG